MSFIVTTDVGGAAVAINPLLVQGITVAPGVTPASCFVRTATEAFVLPGTPAVVAALLAGAGLGAAVVVVKSSDGSILSQNAKAIALGLTVVHNGVGDNTVHFATAVAPSVAETAIALTSLGTAGQNVCMGGSFSTTAMQVTGWDAAAAAHDVNFSLVVFPTE